MKWGFTCLKHDPSKLHLASLMVLRTNPSKMKQDISLKMKIVKQNYKHYIDSKIPFSNVCQPRSSWEQNILNYVNGWNNLKASFFFLKK